jgi:glutamate racemase
MRIGVFDSGLGGLSVLQALKRAFPEAVFLYLGDTARLPYGSKSPSTIAAYSVAAARFLEGQGVDLLVLACHTASAWASDVVRRSVGVPVFDMVGPTVEQVLASSLRGPIAILGTRAMIRSAVYARTLDARTTRELIAQPCPLFVPLVEEGFAHSPFASSIIVEHTEPVRAHGAETVVLGCTHYPVLLRLLQDACGGVKEWIDPAGAVAREIAQWTEQNPMENIGDGRDRLFLTDESGPFSSMGAALLGRSLPQAELVSLEPSHSLAGSSL